MNSNTDRGIGGASIIPSARKSIHSHILCPFAEYSTMGRYKLDDAVNSGTDEIDNVMSKPMSHISPSSFKQINKRSRKSLQNNESFTDDSNILSKSLPATLPSHSYCSGDSEDEQLTANITDKYRSDVSLESAGYGTPRNRNGNHSASYESTPLHISSSNLIQNTSTKSSRKLTLPVVSLIGVLVTVAASVLNISNVSNKVAVYDEFKFYNDIQHLGMEYKIDENSLLQVQTGISTIFERQDTGSFIFVYNNDNDVNAMSKFNKFINDVSFAASKYLRNDTMPTQYTMVEGTNLDMKQHCELISKFRADLDKTGVMLVKHMEAVPSALAMAFHYYCDEYNPLVKKSAIFFTLNLAECSLDTEKRSLHAVIEKCLMKKWNEVPSDSIIPLLTRVVSVVVDVTHVF